MTNLVDFWAGDFGNERHIAIHTMSSVPRVGEAVWLDNRWWSVRQVTYDPKKELIGVHLDEQEGPAHG